MIVTDTNIIAYCIIESDWTSLAVSVYEADQNWAVPRLWRSELCNLLATAIRNSVMTLDDAVLAVSNANILIGEYEFDVDPVRVLELAKISGCTAYDCEFISLAERLSVPLVTSDKKLLTAFPTIAVSMEAFTA